MPVITVSGYSGCVTASLGSLTIALRDVCPGLGEQMVDVVDGGPSLLPESRFLTIEVLLLRQRTPTDEDELRLATALAEAAATILPAAWSAAVYVRWYRTTEKPFVRVRGTARTPPGA